MPRYIFLRTAWMIHYQGVTNDDIPTGAGSYVEENEDGGEVCNFLPIRGYYYGYARIQGGRQLRLERLGADKTDDFIKGVTVVFFAKNPDTGGQYIVGWYKNATLHRGVVDMAAGERLGHNWYMTKAAVSDSYLVDHIDRVFETPEDGPGQTNAWYVEEYHDKKYLAEVEKYINDPDAYIVRNPKRTKWNPTWAADIDHRVKVEKAAMNTVAEYYANRGYTIVDIHKENLGWDMEAVKGNQVLLLEVKGLSGLFNMVELTVNEYLNSKRNKKHYRICVVSEALSTTKKLDIYYHENNKWVNSSGGVLRVEERTSARLYKN